VLSVVRRFDLLACVCVACGRRRDADRVHAIQRQCIVGVAEQEVFVKMNILKARTRRTDFRCVMFKVVSSVPDSQARNLVSGTEFATTGVCKKLILTLALSRPSTIESIDIVNNGAGLIEVFAGGDGRALKDMQHILKVTLLSKLTGQRARHRFSVDGKELTRVETPFSTVSIVLTQPFFDTPIGLCRLAVNEPAGSAICLEMDSFAEQQRALNEAAARESATRSLATTAGITASTAAAATSAAEHDYAAELTGTTTRSGAATATTASTPSRPTRSNSGIKKALIGVRACFSGLVDAGEREQTLCVGGDAFREERTEIRKMIVDLGGQLSAHNVLCGV
jgi:hypothetical protein